MSKANFMTTTKRVAIWLGIVVGGGILGSLLVGQSEVICEMAGGDWVPVSAGVGVLYGCGFQRTDDGGRECRSSSECNEHCVTKVNEEVPSLPGECQTHTFLLLHPEGQGIQVETFQWESELLKPREKPGENGS